MDNARGKFTHNLLYIFFNKTLKTLTFFQICFTKRRNT